MIHRSAIITLALALTLSSTHVGLARAQVPETPLEDFADEVHKMNGYYHRLWVIERMMTFKLGDQCWGSMLDRKNKAITTANTFARNVALYAEKLTGEDWDQIEGTGTQQREKNKHLVEAEIEKLRPDLHVTISHEGGTCDASGDGLLIKYWAALGNILLAHPPTSGRAIVVLHLTPKAKDISFEVSRDGTRFSFTLPSERQVVDWYDKLKRPFQKASRKR
ncbi:MAG: hypothetical protein AB7T06_33385 [Kofleriaceae bacterium]